MNFEKLFETARQIMVLRGGPTSGNWAHGGRPGKKGGSGRGGGFKRIGVKGGKGLKRDDVKKRAKESSKDTESQAKLIWSTFPKGLKNGKPAKFYKAMSQSGLPLEIAQNISAKFEKEKKVNLAAQNKLDKKRKSLSAKRPELGKVKNATFASHAEMKDAFSDWHETMPGEQNKALARYQRNSGHVGMNDHLRKGRKISDSKMEDIEHAKTALQNASLPKDTILHRGTDLDVYMEQLGNDPSSWVGKTFTDKGFMSTTIDKDEEFFGVKATISAPKGTKGGYLGNLPPPSHINGEKEILLAPGVRMRVTGADLSPNGEVLGITTEIIGQGE